MGRTTGPDDGPSRPRKGDRGRGPRTTQGRSTLISKAFSKLLRHQAVNEGIPISSDGWVRLDHLLAWRGLTGRNGVEPPPSLEDVWDVVKDNDKKRFAVRLTQGSRSRAEAIPLEVQNQPNTALGELVDADSTKDSADGGMADETESAMKYYRNTLPSPPAAEFEIRAVQGHSIQSVAFDASLYTTITLEDPATVPSTCVHGTYYGAWQQILKSGGLKRMGRNHAHFASGPSLAEIGITEQGEGEVTPDSNDKVISGMRNDAQLLIYIDLKRCLEDVKNRALDMQWWRSQNGVILTEGIDAEVEPAESKADGAEDVNMEDITGPNQERAADYVELDSGASKGAAAPRKGLGGRYKAARSKQELAAGQADKIIPMKYWKVVVDVKGGNGVIWRHEEGMVKELPRELLNRGTPKSYRGRGRGRGGMTTG